jgi:hypothetical protein
MKKTGKICSTVLLTALLFSVTTGCDKKPKPEPTPDEKQATTLTVDASDYTKWVYVSFVQGKVVEISDYKNDPSWDMALHRYDVRLNGGESGKGQGAALETTYGELKDLTAIPASGYVTDVMDSITSSIASMPPIQDAQPYNLEASKWITMTDMPPVYTLSGKVYVFKTAEGKHVKIKFTDYRNAEDKTGHIKFSYLYLD